MFIHRNPDLRYDRGVKQQKLKATKSSTPFVQGIVDYVLDRFEAVEGAGIDLPAKIEFCHVSSR